MTTTQDATQRIFRFKHDRAGNLPPLPGSFPDMMAPVIRKNQDGERKLVMARWGMPTPPQFRKGPVDRGVTNIRDAGSAPLAGMDEARVPLPCAGDLFLRADRLTQSSNGTKSKWTWFALGECFPDQAFKLEKKSCCSDLCSSSQR
jgi:hypothetical protein